MAQVPISDLLHSRWRWGHKEPQSLLSTPDGQIPFPAQVPLAISCAIS